MGEDREASVKREQDPRIAKAFRAMKNVDIEAERVRPVLKKLLKLYGCKWELIEADNYRTLADAIFEYEEEQEREKNDAGTAANIECPFKEPNKGLPKNKASRTMDNSNLGMIEMPKRLEGPKLLETSQPSRRDQTAEPSSTRSGIPKRLEGQKLSDRSQPLKRDNTAESSSSRSDRDRRKSPTTVSAQVTRGNHDESDPHQRNQSSREIRDHEKGRKRSREEPLDIIPLTTLSPTCLSKGKYLEANGQASESGSRSIVNKDSGSCCPRLTDGNKKLSLTHVNNKKNSVGPSSSDAPSRSITQCQPVNHNGRRAVHTFFDITKGSENMKIMLLDKSGKESLPVFTYIRENTVYESAQINVSLARIADDGCCSSCSGDCLSSSIPCECARETGGEFAYTPEGLLTKKFLDTLISMGLEPQKHYQYYCADCPVERAKIGRWPEKCKGHLLRKFIKECWRKCGCGMLCGNRVVQRGITRNLQVFLAEEGKGWGLRTLEEIPEGAFICEYVGEVLTNMELYERNESSTDTGRHTYPVLLDADWGSERVLKDEEALCLDGTYYGNVARFINHRCFDGNLLDIPVEVESPDHHYYHLAFFTKRKVEAFEELTWDYGIDFDDHSHPIEAFQCCCKSLYCRDKKGKRVLQ